MTSSWFLFVSGNGYIEGTELDGFLREFISSVNADDCGPEVSELTILSRGLVSKGIVVVSAVCAPVRPILPVTILSTLRWYLYTEKEMSFW